MRARGFTLIETMIAVSIAAILLGITAPSFTSTMAKSRLEGAMQVLSVDLQYTRSQAVRVQRTVTLAVNAAGNSYTISDSSGTLKTVAMPSGVTLTPSASIAFDALRGITAVSTIDGSSSMTAGSLRVATNAVGRVRTCSPSGTIPGYVSC